MYIYKSTFVYVYFLMHMHRSTTFNYSFNYSFNEKHMYIPCLSKLEAPLESTDVATADMPAMGPHDGAPLANACRHANQLYFLCNLLDS